MQLCIFTYDLNKFINCKIKICKIKFTFIKFTFIIKKLFTTNLINFML